MDKVISPDVLTDEQKAALKILTKPPRVAWPTVILCAVLVPTYFGTIYLCATGVWPMWVGAIINSLVGYFAFSVMHDGLHRAISKNERFNDFLTQVGVTLIAPYVDHRMFRWNHILHHRFAGGARDPDNELKGAWWTLPLRWIFLDAIYVTHTLRHGDKVSQKHFKKAIVFAIPGIAIIVGLCLAGYAYEVLMLWLIPSRMAFFLIAFSFLWLPHVPHDTAQEENFTRATTMRFGLEWIMRILLQGHHYHLIHHVYPAAPFYNTEKIWKTAEKGFRQNELAVQHGMAVMPRIYSPDRP